MRDILALLRAAAILAGLAPFAALAIVGAILAERRRLALPGRAGFVRAPRDRDLPAPSAMSPIAHDEPRAAAADGQRASESDGAADGAAPEPPSIETWARPSNRENLRSAIDGLARFMAQPRCLDAWLNDPSARREPGYAVFGGEE